MKHSTLPLLFLLFSCGNSQHELLFDKKYENLCDAFTDISRYAMHLHINGRNRNYNETRTHAMQNLAKDYDYELSDVNSENCADIEEIVASKKDKTSKEIYSEALMDFMQELDPHSLYISEDLKPKMENDKRNVSHGMGVEFKYIHRAVKNALPVDTLIVDYVYPDSPADGILRIGDEVESIDDLPVQGELYSNIANKIAENPESVSLKIKGRTEKIELELIDFQKTFFYTSTLDSDSGHFAKLRIPKFSEGLAKKLKPELLSLQSSTDGLVLDLQGNPGGLVDEAIDVINLFVSGRGEAFFTQGEYQDSGSIYSHHGYDFKGKPVYTKPLIVLVDSDTASSSEIVASLLQQKSRAIILGQKTFGKGSAQIDQLVSTKNGFGGILVTTTSLVYYPSGATHQIRGIDPDYRLINPQFDEAVSILQVKNPAPIFHESEFENPLQPHLTSAELIHSSLIYSLHSDQSTPVNHSAECPENSYQYCLEKQSEAFLSAMALQ